MIKIFQAFRHAFDGIAWAFKTQRHIKIHAIATSTVIILGLMHQLAPWQWCCISLSIGIVWMAELFNTALEVLCDRITLQKDDSIKRVKDVAAGAVLATAIMATVIAALIFLSR